jgi:hypothetical protein
MSEVISLKGKLARDGEEIAVYMFVSLASKPNQVQVIWTYTCVSQCKGELYKYPDLLTCS